MPVLALILVAAFAGGAGFGDLTTPGGEMFSLDAMLADGPVVLVFWNSWLPRSRAFVPLVAEVERAAARARMKGAVVLFQDTDPNAWAGLAEGSLPRVVDRRGTLVRRLEVTRAPAVVILERDGSIRASAGPDADDVRRLLGTLGGT